MEMRQEEVKGRWEEGRVALIAARAATRER